MFKGVITPVITTFDKQGRLDFYGMEAIIEHLIDGGMNGLLFLGSIGEFFALRKEEKQELISFVVGQVKKRIPVLIGTGGTIVDETVELTRFAEKVGADAAVAISPYYFQLDEEDLYRYYREVAQAVKMPVLLYNFPDRTSVNLTPQLVTRLAQDFSNIIGIKDTVDNISHTRQLIQFVKKVKPEFAVFSGFDEYFIPNLMVGGDGVICGLTNIAPELFNQLLRDYRDDNFAGVKQGQSRIATLMNIYQISQPFVAAIKGAVALRGLPVQSIVKAPSMAVNGDQEAKIKMLLEAAEVKVKQNKYKRVKNG